MTISKTLFDFARKNNNTLDILNNPEKYLGPYTKKLLEFWNKLDTLNPDQWKTIEVCYKDFHTNQETEYLKATAEADKASKEAIGWEFAFDAADAAHGDFMHFVACKGYSYSAYYATREIIGGVKNPVFPPMFDKFLNS